MKYITLAAVAAITVATPAIAQTNAAFVGPRIEATAGYNDVINARDRNDIVYGAAVGADIPVGDRFTVGADANASNVFEANRQIGASARVGYAFTTRTLGYVRGGYNNYRNYALVGKHSFRQNLDGFVVGAGVEHMLTDRFYAKAEYRYSDFQNHVGDSGVVAGVGFRF